jgi:hypothetical protein
MLMTLFFPYTILFRSLAELYEEVTDAIAIELSTASVFGAIFDYVILIIGAFAGPTAAAYANLGKTGFDAFVNTADTLGNDVWTNEFTEELTCFLLDHATDAAGIITFDWPAMRGEITEKFLEAGGELDADRALLWGQVGYLFDILAAGGINHAGATTAIATYDCASCDEAWCYEWNWFDGGTHDWTVNRGTPTAGFGIVRVQDPVTLDSRVRVTRTVTIPSGSIWNSVCTTYNFLTGSSSPVRWVRWNGTVISEVSASAGEQTDCDPGVEIEGPVTGEIEIVLDDTWFDQIYLIGFQMSGTGPMPALTGGEAC